MEITCLFRAVHPFFVIVLNVSLKSVEDLDKESRIRS